MARLRVINEGVGARTPFLRGILTSSLQDAGVEFEAAYRIASDVRDELSDENEVCPGVIREHVEKHIRSMGEEVLRRYRRPGLVAPPMNVRLSHDEVRPYSRGSHRSSLWACGIETQAAHALSAGMYDDLVAEGCREIEISDLRRRTYARLARDLGEGAARRYLAWEGFRHGDQPLILLIGGTTGTGKSTTATRVAHLLDIVRTQSTDMLREVMRMMIPPRLVPALHVSSFAAWEVLNAPGSTASAEAVAEGFLRQAELLGVAGTAVLQRAATERVSVVIEGVHVHPKFLQEAEEQANAIVVRVMMAVMRPQELKRRIRGRGKEASARRAQRYLNHFDEIWDLQSYLLSEADQAGVPIVADEDLETASRQVVEVVMRTLLDRPLVTPEQAFG